MVCKRSLRTDQMTSVDLASDYAKRMVLREAKGPGDVEDAMRRIESMTGIGFSTLWSLRYRPPKTICHDKFQRIREAYLSLCERQLSSLRHELEIEATRGRSDAFVDLVDEAEAVAAKLKAARAAS
jgi:hypothetical protein